MRQHLLARATACKMQLCTASLATASLLANLLAPLVLRYMQVQLQSFALYPNIRSIRSKAKLCNRTDAKHYFALRTDFLASRFTFLPPKTEISEKQKSKTQKQKCKSTCTDCKSQMMAFGQRTCTCSTKGGGDFCFSVLSLALICVALPKGHQIYDLYFKGHGFASANLLANLRFALARRFASPKAKPTQLLVHRHR